MRAGFRRLGGLQAACLALNNTWMNYNTPYVEYCFGLGFKYRMTVGKGAEGACQAVLQKGLRCAGAQRRGQRRM